MESWRSAGDLLRWWRTDVLGWTQQQAADRLNVRPNALSNWERGERAMSLDAASLDRDLQGEGLLADLLWSHGTPEGLEAGRTWSWVFPGDSRPVWMWLRSPTPRIVLEAEWGVARLEEFFELGPNGLFVTVGASLPDSPVVIHLSAPGWADFGSGTLPPEIPGGEVVAAVDLMQRSSARGPLMDMFSSTLQARVESGAPGAIDLAQNVPGAIDSYRDRRVPSEWNPDPEGLEAIERQRYARLRQARALSLAALTARVDRLTDVEVSRDTIRRFETDIGRPHHPQLPVAIDHALGAGGRLAILELRSGRGEGSVPFPPYWRGPFWIDFQGDDGIWPVSLVLRRGHWHREVELAGPGLVSAHWFDPALPVRIAAPPEVRWTVGVGRRAGARAIDQNWVPTTVDVAKQAVSDIEEAIYGAVLRSRPRPEDGPDHESGHESDDDSEGD